MGKRSDEPLHLGRGRLRAPAVSPMRLLCVSLPLLYGCLFAQRAMAQAAAGPSQQPSGTTVNLGTIPVTASALNPDGSTAASGGMYVPAPTFGPFGPTPDKDIPFTTFTIPQQVLQNQQVHSTYEALKNDPSTLAFNPDQFAEFYRIRGFALTGNYIRQDGLNVLNGFSPAIENDESVDVLKGATSALYGFAAPAGIVNYHSKMPLDIPLTQVGVGYISRGQVNESLDVSRRFGTNNQFGVRVNIYQDNGSAPIQGTSVDRNTQSIAFDWKPNSEIRLWTRVEHNALRLNGEQPAFFLPTNLVSLPRAPDPSTYFGQPWMYGHQEAAIAEAGLDWSHDGWTARAAIGYSSNTLHSVVQGTGQIQAADLQQNGTYGVRGTYQKDAYINRAATVSISREIATGPVKQTFSANYTGSDNVAKFNGLQTAPPGLAPNAILGLSSIYAPVIYPQPNVALPSIASRQELRLNSVVLFDRVDAGSFTILGGTVYSTYDNASNSVPETLNGGSYLYQNKFTPIVAALVRPTQWITGYFSYISALQPGSMAPSTAVNANQTLPPFFGDQYEVGLKYQVTSGLEVNGALFKIEQANAILGTDNVYRANGTQEVNGVELTYAGRITPDLAIIGGGTLLDATVHSTPTDPQNDQHPYGVPRGRITFYGEYTVPPVPGLTLLGGVYYTAESLVQINKIPSVGNVSIYSPGYTTLDLGATYSFRVRSTPVILRAYVENALNKHYYFINAPGGSAVSFGAPITGKLSLTANF